MTPQIWLRICLLYASFAASRCESFGASPDAPLGSVTAVVELDLKPNIKRFKSKERNEEPPSTPKSKKKGKEKELKQLPAKVELQATKSSSKPAANIMSNLFPNGASDLKSVALEVTNIMATLAPSGMIPIAFGMAAAGGTGLGLSTCSLVLFGALSWYSLISFARAASTVTPKSGEATVGERLSEVWSRVIPNGSSTSFIPDLGSFLLLGGCLLFYSAFVGDLFVPILEEIGGFPGIFSQRWAVLLALHAFPILPLCLTQGLSFLKYSHLVGLGGVLYTIFFMWKRLLDGSFSEGGKFFQLMPSYLQPAFQNLPRETLEQDTIYLSDIMQVFFNSKALPEEPQLAPSVFRLMNELPLFQSGGGLLILMSMCSAAFACDSSAIKSLLKFKQLPMTTIKGTLGVGIGGTGLLLWVAMFLGYASFGANAQTLILDNYGSQDVMALTARASAGIAIILAYARMFEALKENFLSLIKLDGKYVVGKGTKQAAVSLLLLAAVASGACLVTEYELASVIGVVGSLFGSLVVCAFPALINNSLLSIKDESGKFLAKPFFKGEQVFNILLLVFGVAFAAAGTWGSLTML